MPPHLRSVVDITAEDIDYVLRRAREFDQPNTLAIDAASRPRVLGLLFMQPSLRTRLGFAAAAARLGWHTAQVFEQREHAEGISESLADTVRVLSGFVDVVVARLRQPVATLADALTTTPFINGGDSGPAAEHPTQALIDVFAMEQALGPLRGLDVAICGDPRMRAVRSLLRLFAGRPPRSLSLISVPDLIDSTIDDALGATPVTHRRLDDLSGIDVLYAAGIPHRAIPEPLRDTLRITAQSLRTLPSSSIVLSPLPIIDEIDGEARADTRMKMFEQSDRSVAVRMAILERAAHQGFGSASSNLPGTRR